MGHQAHGGGGWGLRKPGFSEVETGPTWTGRSRLAEARNAGATDHVGLSRRGGHVLQARGKHSHADSEAGGR